MFLHLFYLVRVSFRSQGTLIAKDIIHHFIWRPSSVQANTHSALPCGLQDGETPSDSGGQGCQVHINHISRDSKRKDGG